MNSPCVHQHPSENLFRLYVRIWIPSLWMTKGQTLLTPKNIPDAPDAAGPNFRNYSI